MTYPSDKRKKSISFHEDTWEKISRRKNLSGFINDLIREHFDEKSKQKSLPENEKVIQDLIQKNQEQEKIIQDYLSGWENENYYNFRTGLEVSKGVTSWQKRMSE